MQKVIKSIGKNAIEARIQQLKPVITPNPFDVDISILKPSRGEKANESSKGNGLAQSSTLTQPSLQKKNEKCKF